MKKLIKSTPAKIAAFLLSYVMVLLFIFSSVITLLMVKYQFYFSNEKTVKSEILTDMANREASYISYRLDHSMNLADYYSDKNVFYQVVDLDGEVFVSNYKGEKYIASGLTEYYEYVEHAETDEDGNSYYTGEEIYKGNIKVFIPENMTHNDTFSLVAKIVEIGFNLKYFAILIATLSCIFAITLICFLFCAAGHTAEGIRLNYLDRVPLDLYIAVLILLALGNAVVFSEMSYSIVPSVAVILTLGTIDYFCILGFLLSFATRIKTGTWFKNTLFYRILRGIKRTFEKPIEYLKFTFSNLSLVKKTAVITAFAVVFEFFFILYSYALIVNYAWEGVIIPVIILSLALFAFVIYIAVILQKIKEGGEEISRGNLEHKIDTKYMFGDFKEFSDNVNNINTALQNAVEERMKSEHFRVELITNVSHDIKTPLTSIINYVDLIKKEGTDNTKVNEYIDVLDRQSNRLKKLVEDLVEASKASSGNLSVELCPCNVGILLNQAVGEFTERLKNADLTPVIKTQEENITVLADGRHLWRVFDNLLSNVCKYSMPGTRVYITVTDNAKRTEITFRNISKYELDMGGDELMERFTRGDKSRNTEGHGLGLSIAESLLTLQGAGLEVTVDGDLFKATVIFPKKGS